MLLQTPFALLAQLRTERQMKKKRCLKTQTNVMTKSPKG